MTRTGLTFLVECDVDGNHPSTWASDAFRLPEVRLIAARASDGSQLRAARLNNGILYADTGNQASVQAVVEVPDNLISFSHLEQQKLLLERERMGYEEANRRRTYFWTIGAALLSAAVTLAVALISKTDFDKAEARGPEKASADSIQSCHGSLKRLPDLARLQGQTVQNLAAAIDRHVAECDDVLIRTLASR